MLMDAENPFVKGLTYRIRAMEDDFFASTLEFVIDTLIKAKSRFKAGPDA
jgi:hypothetical protein